jgi:curved DNA-binding protein CbpA
MTYYEELGIPEAASIEEIRHAYRRLVRLVHPDQIADEELRRLAELQMKRLNGVLAELVDEERRAVYDASLRGPLAAVAVPRVLGPMHVRWGAAAVLVLLGAVMLWPRRQAVAVAVAAHTSRHAHNQHTCAHMRGRRW